MEYYLAVIAFTFVGAITPGPNNIMLMASGLNHGIHKSLPHYLGICLGFPVMVLFVGFGFGAVFIQYPRMHQVIKVVGVVYLCYLAWKIANAGNPKASEGVGAPFTFLQAAAFQWVNPKAWAIAAGAIAAFTVVGRVSQSIAFITFSVLLAGFVGMGVWLMLGTSLKKLLRYDRRISYFNITMAILLLLSIVPLVKSDLSA